MPRSFTWMGPAYISQELFAHKASYAETYPWDELSHRSEYAGTIRNDYPNDGLLRERTFFGGRTPNWKQFRKQNGYLPTLECRDRVLTIEPQVVSQYKYSGDSFGTYLTEIRTSNVRLSSSDIPWESGLTDEAWSKLRQKVLAQDFNAPVFLAEAGKTVDMIVNSATRVTRALKALRRGRINEVRRALAITRKRKLPRQLEGKSPKEIMGLSPGELHNSWLELQYGWKPLLADIHGAAKTLAELRFRRDQHTFKASVKKNWRYEGTSGHKMTGQASAQSKVWATVRVHDRATQVMNSLGLLNPATIAWEVTPFSFVVDWFVNIGDCIAEATAFAGVTVLDGGWSEVITFNGDIVETNFSPYSTPLRSKMEYRKYRRYPGVQTMPVLRVKSDPLNLTKLVTSAALMRQQFKRDARTSLRI